MKAHIEVDHIMGVPGSAFKVVLVVEKRRHYLSNSKGRTHWWNRRAALSVANWYATRLRLEVKEK